MSQVGFSKCRPWNRVWAQIKGSKEGEEARLSGGKCHRWNRPQKDLPILSGTSGVSIAHESHPTVSWNVWASKPSPGSFSVGCLGKGMTDHLFAAKADLKRTGSWRYSTHHLLPAGQQILPWTELWGAHLHVYHRPSWRIWLTYSASVHFSVWHPALWHPNMGSTK